MATPPPVSTSGPRNRAPRRRNVSTSPRRDEVCAATGRDRGVVTSPSMRRACERGLVGARHEHDVASHHVADRAREQRVVRAAEDSVSTPAARTGASSRSASTCTWSESTSPASTNSTKPGHAAHVSSMPAAAAARWYAPEAIVPTVPIDADATGARRRGRGPHARLDHADDRDVVRGPGARRARPPSRCCTRRRAS